MTLGEEERAERRELMEVAGRTFKYKKEGEERTNLVLGNSKKKK